MRVFQVVVEGFWMPNRSMSSYRVGRLISSSWAVGAMRH